MSQGSTGASLVAAALILGASLVAGSYLVATSIDRGTAEIANLSTSLKVVAAHSQVAAKPAAAPTRPTRPDPAQVYEVEIGDAPVRGDSDAKITIVEFADFQCPYCGHVGPTLDQIMDEYGEDVRIAFKHLPLSFHEQARGAHQAAEAAHRQGRFWEMHDLIFANQRRLSEEDYLGYAAEMGLDLQQFKSDAASQSVKSRIAEDLETARSLSVTGTPAFFINGRFLSGAQPFASFQRVIEEELAKN
jgi:protein-disulfide isomerase